MQPRKLTVWVALVVLALVVLAGSTSALYAGNADQTSHALQDKNYDGSNEPDNPDCPPPSEYPEDIDYNKYGHDCAVPNDPRPGDHPLMYGDDFTEVTWNSHWFFYGQGQHEPGYKGASYAFRSWPVKEDFDLEFFEYVAIYAPWGQFGGESEGECTVADTQAAGIDRGNDGNRGKYHSTGGGGDDSLVSAIQNSRVNGTYGYFQFAGPDSFGDRNIPLNSSDAFVAALGNCWANPEEPGWYRMTVWFNGTNYQGEEIGWKGYNHWQYFCSDCENRQDAIEKFGPPGTNPDNPWKDTTVSKQASTATATERATATVTPTPPPDGSTPSATPTSTPASDTGSTATATEPPTATATPTRTDTATSTATDTPSPTSGNQGGSNTPTPSATATDDAGGGGGDGGGDTATQQRQGADTGSPTAQSGPGFGLVAALIGLVGLGLWAVRRP